MKKELSIIFVLLIVILSVSVLAINLPDVSPEKVFGISSGMQTPDIIVRIAVWVIVFFVLYGILRTFFGWFLGVLLAIGSVILLGYFGIVNSLLKNTAVIVANLGALGIILIIILTFIVAIIVPFASNKLAIWWMKTSAKMRARKMTVFFFCFFIFLLGAQFIIAAQGIPETPIGKDAPYALNRSKSVFLTIYEGFTGLISKTCDTLKKPSKFIVGKECAMQVSFLVAVLIAVFFIIMLYDLLTNFSTFSSTAGFFISLALTLIIANFGIISWITDSLMFLFGTTKGVIILVLVLILAALAFSFLRKYVKQAKEEKKKVLVEIAQEKTLKAGQEISKSFE